MLGYGLTLSVGCVFAFVPLFEVGILMGRGLFGTF